LIAFLDADIITYHDNVIELLTTPQLKNTMVVGDSENDMCCIRKAGIDVSFCTTNNLVDSVADYIIKEPNFNLLLPI